MKIERKHMISILGLLLAGCGALLVAKIIGMSGIKNTFLTSSLGVLIGFVCRELFKKSVKHIQDLEGIQIKNLREKNKKLLKEKDELQNKASLKIINTGSAAVTISLSISKQVEKKIAENKNQTVVNLFLLSEKKSLLVSKFIAIILLMLGVLAVVWLDLGPTCLLPGAILYCLLEFKERILTYRVVNGFFGANAAEALALIKFIHENIDDISNNSDGGKRKILNDEIKPQPESVSLPGEVQHG